MSPLPRRVLIIRMGALGDVVNALVLAAALKREDPGVTIGWAVHELSLPLVDGHPSVDRVHLWSKKRGLAGLAAFLRGVRRERYELAVDLQRLAKSSLVARLSGAPRVLGYDRERAKEHSWLLTRERIPPGDPRSHMVQHYLEFARYLGVDAERPVFQLPSDPAAEEWAEAVVAPLAEAPVVVNMGASKALRRWPHERFGELAARVPSELGRPALLVGGPAELEEGGRARELVRGVEGVVDLVGRAGVLQLAALERRSALFIGCDTGPMHLAAAVGTPVVALFGPSDASRTGPYGAGHVIVQGEAVFPSEESTQRSGWGLAHMDDVRVERVLEVARDVLARRAGAGTLAR